VAAVDRHPLVIPANAAIHGLGTRPARGGLRAAVDSRLRGNDG